MKKGAIKKTHIDATETGAVKMKMGPFNALIVHHRISGGGSTGGHVSLSLSPDNSTGSYVAHHGGGENIPSGAQANSYTALFTGLMDYVEVTLTATDKTHNVSVQPVQL